MPKILISAGIHGDEPAGVEAILTFLEQHLPRWRDQFHTMFSLFKSLRFLTTFVKTRTGSILTVRLKMTDS